MLPVKRPHLPFQPPCSSTAAAADRSSSRGWLSVWHDPSNRSEDDGNGTPLSDDMLLVIFDGLPELIDRVCSAFTCRRWGLLVFANGLFASRVVASRNGLVVLDLRRDKKDRALKLCVCNTMTGEVHVLPPLSGKDGLGHYACTVLTADDLDDKNTDPPRSSYYRLLMLYSRRGFTAFRKYSSDDGSWSEEAEVTKNRLDQKQMGLTQMGVVAHGGSLTYWLAKKKVFELQLDTLEAKVEMMPRSGNGRGFLLGLSPEGNLCAVQFDRLSLKTAKRRVSVCISTCSSQLQWFDTKELIRLEQFLPADVSQVKLQWFGERSRVVFFTAVSGSPSDRRSEMYALRLGTKTVKKVASHAGNDDPWGNLHGYEKGQAGQAAYLASLAERDVMEDL